MLRSLSFFFNFDSFFKQEGIFIFELIIFKTLFTCSIEIKRAKILLLNRKNICRRIKIDNKKEVD